MRVLFLSVYILVFIFFYCSTAHLLSNKCAFFCLIFFNSLQLNKVKRSEFYIMDKQALIVSKDPKC
jgi:hypothetical protein